MTERTEAPRTETRSPFVAPEIAVPAPREAAAGPSELASEFAEPAVVWSLGIFCYTLLAGYPPFESSSAMCPFFKDYSTMNRLACPPHFSAPAIALLCATLTLAPEARIKLEASRHPTSPPQHHPRSRPLSILVPAPAPSAPAPAPPALAHHRSLAERHPVPVPLSPLSQDLPRACSAWAAQLAAPASAACALPAQNLAARSQVTASLGALSLSRHPTGSSQDLQSLQSLHPAKRQVGAAQASCPAAAGGGGGCGAPDAAAADAAAHPPGALPGHPPGGPPPATDPPSPTGDEPPSPAPEPRRVVGPHGTPLAEVRMALSPHPNTPPPTGHGRQHRPVAVIFSPSSGGVRKTTLSSTSLTAPQCLAAGRASCAGAASSAGAPSFGNQRGFAGFAAPAQALRPLGGAASLPKVGRRLGWDVNYEGDSAQLLADLLRAITALEIEASVDEAQQCLTTAQVQVSRDMGLGSMQAFLVVGERGAAPDDLGADAAAAGRRRYRIDVKRKGGDTFQFHAFYRQLRDSLRPLIMTTLPEDAPACGSGGRGGGGAAPDVGAAGWGRRL